MARCVKCGKCLEACPYRAVHVAPGNAGAAAGTPVIDAREQACRLCEDFPCVAACPTGALRDVEARADVHMGTAVIEEDLCIALQGMRCEVCYRVCPLIDEAMTIDYRMREGDAIHAVFAPRIDREKCVGCGLCVERCVVGEPRVASPHRGRPGPGAGGARPQGRACLTGRRRGVPSGPEDSPASHGPPAPRFALRSG